jgi:hypothetical protein
MKAGGMAACRQALLACLAREIIDVGVGYRMTFPEST